MLKKCDYNIEEAKRQIKRRRCLDEKWSAEDVQIFRSTFPVFKKDFSKIAKMVGCVVNRFWLAANI